MQALENDLIVFIQLVQALNQYADTIRDEARRRELFNVSNRVNRITDACSSFITHMKTNLNRESATQLEAILQEEHALDSLTLLLWFIQFTPAERENLLEIIRAAYNHKTITIND